MLHIIDKNKKVAPKLIFFNKFFLERFEGFLTLKIDFENQILALFDVYFWPFNKSREKINTSNSVDMMKNLHLSFQILYNKSWIF